ncbi:hypothetical protein Q5P01_010706 [Channa striata]|uniref:Uncharacterized protein n=1 Tax=Channa striata TaxID=64152 RepID=A0AA88SPX8_CHASR|nr:hypothetical protein Q5P01_010706 [Channa striata]
MARRETTRDTQKVGRSSDPSLVPLSEYDSGSPLNGEAPAEKTVVAAKPNGQDMHGLDASVASSEILWKKRLSYVRDIYQNIARLHYVMHELRGLGMINQEELDHRGIPGRRQDPRVGGSRRSKRQCSLHCLHGGLGQCGHRPDVAVRRANERGCEKSEIRRGHEESEVGPDYTPSDMSITEILAYLGELSRDEFGLFKWFLANMEMERFLDVAKPLRAGFEERRGDDIRAEETSQLEEDLDCTVSQDSPRRSDHGSP